LGLLPAAVAVPVVQQPAEFGSTLGGWSGALPISIIEAPTWLLMVAAGGLV